MIEFLPWILGVVLVLAVLAYVWHSLKETKTTGTAPEDRHHAALDLWVDGDLAGATSILEDLVHDYPGSIDPYLHLGILLRLQGDAKKASVLHHGLTVRTDLTRPKKIAVGLALAEDLLDLEQYSDAREVLDTLIRDASGKTRYWRARFRHWHGEGNFPEAARALKRGIKVVPEADRAAFAASYASYQLDRALQSVRSGDFAEARPRLKDVRKMPEAQPREPLVRAMLAAADNNPTEAVTIASENLLDSPEELAIFLPMLQHVLLASGQYARTVPILERACQSQHAPPSLWVDLALLYEKLGEREKALRLLESKSGHGSFTPDKAAPLMKLLVNDAAGSDFARLWRILDMPKEHNNWLCSRCGRKDTGVRWFCPACHRFDTYTAEVGDREAL